MAAPLLLALAALCLCASVRAEVGAGRGGPFLQFHAKPLNAFDPALSGNIMVVGGKGVGSFAKNFRLGGAGGGGFAWGAGEDVSFGMGYGGVQAEYSLTSWLTAGMLIGGGGFAISRIVAETPTTTTFDKISSGGFLLFYPSVDIEIKLRNSMTLIGNLGYFLPTNTRLHSMTVGVSLMMGKL
jgi:hypothetical protein